MLRSDDDLKGRNKYKILQSKNRPRYTVGDKCGSFVVMPQLLDKLVTNNVPSDQNTYGETNMSSYTKACEKVKEVIAAVVQPKLGTKLAKRLIDPHPAIPTFYSVIKTHKLHAVQNLRHLQAEEIKTRPIISSCGGPADRLSWLLVKLLPPLLQFVGAHIVNADSFLASLLQCDLSRATTYASLDVVSLYTNVDNRSAVEAVIASYERNQSQIATMGFDEDDIKVMLEAVLGCNIFSFNNQLLVQKRGLAMGNRIAPLLAIIYLDSVERMTISSDVLLYKRYVDDVFIIGTTETNINMIHKRLNSFNQISSLRWKWLKKTAFSHS